jgi:ribosome maturation protein SDO1
VKFTNVAVIRLKKGGKKFELACYKNKLMNWRNKQETNINEVLQTDQVFTNVSKGAIANQKDLKVFGKMSVDEII